ncbi:hypothetical protein Mapa_001953 [Marchantia paleacea]|nr:hypothetical protein Mapa_001953 [Marchantia paleacea]
MRAHLDSLHIQPNSTWKNAKNRAYSMLTKSLLHAPNPAKQSTGNKRESPFLLLSWLYTISTNPRTLILISYRF